MSKDTLKSGYLKQIMRIPRPIRTEEDYKIALNSIEFLIDAQPERGTPSADLLEVLSIIVEDYEKKQFPTTAPTFIAAIKFRMEQQGLNQTKVADMTGIPKSRLSEVLKGKRQLSLRQIRELHIALDIPHDSLMS